MKKYRSNNGKGPLLAVVIKNKGDVVVMVRWHEKHPSRKVEFMLSRKFLASPSCGWKEVADDRS